ncbi:hypothetical protein ABMC89_01595 [Sulfitobacter sp. HNIBRBA3233]|uniref:hypothetical protein n=1 Tax=Sulfitobacter marinivivus TaxID=3158558 RepID=UPI0032DF4727
MTRTNDRFGIWSVLRPLGLLLLISLFVFQTLSPPAAAAPSAGDSHADHHATADAALSCPNDARNGDASMDGVAGHDGAHDGAAHCMPLMCCLHDTGSSYKLAMVGTLLPDPQIIDRGTAPSSNAGTTQDRPPRHL